MRSAVEAMKRGAATTSAKPLDLLRVERIVGILAIGPTSSAGEGLRASASPAARGGWEAEREGAPLESLIALRSPAMGRACSKRGRAAVARAPEMTCSSWARAAQARSSLPRSRMGPRKLEPVAGGPSFITVNHVGGGRVPSRPDGERALRPTSAGAHGRGGACARGSSSCGRRGDALVPRANRQRCRVELARRSSSASLRSGRARPGWAVAPPPGGRRIGGGHERLTRPARWIEGAVPAGTSTTVSRWSPSGCRRCGSAARTSCSSRRHFTAKLRRAAAGPAAHARRETPSRCSRPLLAAATSASSRT